MRLDDLQGQRLGGRYLVGALLGRGGMAAVYRAQDTLLLRDVALKILFPHLTHDAALVERFEREAVVAARLDHPNIVAIYDVGTDQGMVYIAMRLLEGQTLADLLRARQTLPLAELAPIVTQIAAALDYAHRRGVIHRDIKPANVLLVPQPDGTTPLAVLTDFGIAKALDAPGMTSTGALIGTPDYMAPEQINGEPVDARTDIYALGILVYRALTGRRPYEGSTEEVLFGHLRGTPPTPSSLMPALSAGVDEALLRALARNPDQRYQTAGGFAAALTAARAGTQVTPPLAPAGSANATTPPLAEPVEANSRAVNPGSINGRGSSTTPGTSGGAAAAAPRTGAPGGAAARTAPRARPASNTNRWPLLAVIAISALALVGLGGWMLRGAFGGGSASAPTPPPPPVQASSTATSEPSAAATATEPPTATITANPTAAPSVTAAPAATATARPSAAPRPSATPRPNPTAAPPTLTFTPQPPTATQAPPSATASVTAVPATLTPTDTPAPGTPTPCAVNVTGAFARLLDNSPQLRDTLGCPLEPQSRQRTTLQEFTNGNMIAIGAQSGVFVLTGDDQGTLRVITQDEINKRATPVATPAPPPIALAAPFAPVWNRFDEVRTTIGDPTTAGEVSNATYQPFNGGVLLAVNSKGAKTLLVLVPNRYERYLDSGDP